MKLSMKDLWQYNWLPNKETNLFMIHEEPISIVNERFYCPSKVKKLVVKKVERSHDEHEGVFYKTIFTSDNEFFVLRRREKNNYVSVASSSTYYLAFFDSEDEANKYLMERRSIFFDDIREILKSHKRELNTLLKSVETMKTRGAELERFLKSNNEYVEEKENANCLDEICIC